MNELRRTSPSVTLAIVMVTLLSACSLSLELQNVEATNSPPLLLNDDLLALGLDAVAAIDVVANDEEPSLEVTAINIVSAPPQVTVNLLSASQIEISSSGGYQGDVTIEYEATNESGQTGTANLVVNVGHCSGERLADSPFANSSLGADGSNPANAFEICSFEQFNNIGSDSSHWDKEFKLVYNLNFSGMPFGDYNQIGELFGVGFTGAFDGQGFEINNIDWEVPGGSLHTGLFSVLSAVGEIKNLKIANASIRGSNLGYVGILVGHINGFACSVEKVEIQGSIQLTGSNTNIGGLAGRSECSISNSIVDVDIQVETYSGGGAAGIGGIVGDLFNGTVDRSAFIGSVSIQNPSASMSLGGIAGRTGGLSVITNSFTTGAVSGSSNSDIGPILGFAFGGPPTTANNFFANDPGLCSNPGTGSCNAFGGAGVDTTVGTGDPSYFLGNSLNPPLNTWDFLNDWGLEPGNYPSIVF